MTDFDKKAQQAAVAAMVLKLKAERETGAIDASDLTIELLATECIRHYVDGWNAACAAVSTLRKGVYV